MTNDCKTCPVSTGTHKPAEAMHQIDEPQADALLELAAYRFTVANREARIAELEAELEAVGAGGVQRLAAAPQAAVPSISFDFKQAHDLLEMFGGEPGEVIVCVGGGHSGQGMYAVWAADTEGSIYLGVTDDDAAPAHPAEGVPAQDAEAKIAELLALARIMVRTALDADNKTQIQEIKAAIESEVAFERALRAAIAATQPAAQGIDGREFPPLTPELASILGLPCFQCIPFAKALRAAGHTIKTRAEDEQAAVLHWMLGHYFRHGDDWSGAAAQDMSRMKAEALAAQAKQGEQP